MSTVTVSPLLFRLAAAYERRSHRSVIREGDRVREVTGWPDEIQPRRSAETGQTTANQGDSVP
jgi:hypothetical protein